MNPISAFARIGSNTVFHQNHMLLFQHEIHGSKIRLKSLLVLRTRGNYPTSRKSANDIAASNPPRQNRFVCGEVSSTLTQTEMDAQILQLFEMFFDKLVAEIFVQNCLNV